MQSYKVASDHLLHKRRTIEVARNLNWLNIVFSQFRGEKYRHSIYPYSRGRICDSLTLLYRGHHTRILEDGVRDERQKDLFVYHRWVGYVLHKCSVEI